MKRRIRLTESDLRNIVKKSVKRVLREWDEDEYDDGSDIEWAIDDICEEFGDGEVEISGVLGLWDGQHTIEPETSPDIRSAIYRCIGRDGEIMSPEDINFDGADTVTLSVSHHDGTNNFEITRI